jgi:HlyD family secretion protein
MQTKLFPKEVIENTAEVYLPKVSVRGQLIYTTLLLFIVSALLILPFIKVDVSIRAQGITRTLLEKNELKTIISGTIQSVFVEDNQQVRKDEVLLLLDTENIDVKLKLNITQQNLQAQLIQDLEKLLTYSSFDKVVALRSTLYTQQYNQLYFTLLEKKSQLQKAIQDLDRAKLLFSQKVIAATELEEKQFAFDKLSAEYNTLTATQRSAWTSDLNNLKISYNELKSQEKQLQQEKTLYQVKAPTDGTFQLVSGKYKGNYLQAGEVIGTISPDTALIAECYLTPRDIGLMQEGLKVKFQIDAFNYNEWGFAEGEVIDIARDFVLVENKPVFKVKCKLNTVSLTLKNGFKGHLKKGMTLRARFVVTQRSLFQLLYDSLDDWINPMAQ